MNSTVAMNSASLTTVLLLSFLLLVLIAWRMLHRMQCAADNTYDWRDLLMENGKASKPAHVMFGAFVATTWFFVYYAVTGKMTEGYFGIYVAAWIAPVVTRLIVNPANAAQIGEQK